jgi:hypothetical protein
MSTRIPVERLRAEVDAAGIDAYELAAELGWRDKRGWIDAERVKRILGQHTYQAGRRAPETRQGVNYATAERIREVLRAHAAPSRTQPGQNTAATGEKGQRTAG